MAFDQRGAVGRDTRNRMDGGGKYRSRRSSSEVRIGVFTDSGNSGFLGGLKSAAVARDDNKRHIIVRAKKKRPSIPHLEEGTVQMDVVGLSDGDRSYVLDKTRAAIAKLGQTNYGELAGFMKDSMDSRFGPEWQCVVGTKEAFGSCLSPTSTFYSLLCVDKICVLLFKS